jgi:threonine aldolase
MIKRPAHFIVTTAAVEIENTHNFGGGTVQPLEVLQQISALCREQGLKLHLDGARLWNAHVKTGVPMIEYGKLFDTVNVCYSKGLGAPVGSVLVGSAQLIERARYQRKVIGGGWRQAGVLAAAALYALDHNVERLAQDHENAAVFADLVHERAPKAITRRPQTNIVVMETGSRSADAVVAAAQAGGVRLSEVSDHTVRAVTHLDVSAAECQTAGKLVAGILAD